jgi:hypothetical protein
MDPSFLQLSRIIHQEQVQAAANKQRFREAAIASPSLRECILSSVGNGLIFVGKRLKVGQQKDPIQSLKAGASRARS